MKKMIPGFLAAFMILTAFDRVDYFPTSLKITVVNELGNTVEGAEVQLFLTPEDHKNETNPATEKLLTNEKGQVKFKDLEPVTYYVLAEKDDKNNWGAGEKIETLQKGKLNKVTIVIE